MSRRAYLSLLLFTLKSGFSIREILPSILSSYFSDRSSSPPPPPIDNTKGPDNDTHQTHEAEETEDEVAQINENAKQSKIINRLEHETESNKDMTKQCAGVLGDLERRTCANPNITLEEIEFKKASSFLHLKNFCKTISATLFHLKR